LICWGGLLSSLLLSICPVSFLLYRLRRVARWYHLLNHRTTTTTTTTVLQPLSGTTRVSLYQKKHSPIHHPHHHPIFISFFHLPRSIAFSLFKLRAWQSFCTISLHVLLVWSPPPHIPYISSPNQCLLFRNTCPYHCNLFCCSSNIISSTPSLCLNSLLGTLAFTLPLHIYLTILISAR